MIKYCLSIFILFLTFSLFLTAQPQLLKNSQQYLDNRIATNNHRYPSFLLSLAILKIYQSKILVETGTARNGDQNFWGDGGSTIIFGDWADRNQATFYTVDCSQTAINHAMQSTRVYEKSIRFICQDSIQFLKDFDQPIDFLYLDSFDFDENDPKPSQEHHLKEIIAAYPKLHKKTVVMIDDCNLPHGGKGALVIDYLLSKGWKILFKSYQAILIQDDDEIFKSLLHSLKKKEAKDLKIHLICYRNGVGLNQDIDLLQEELSKLGHQVEFIDFRSNQKKALSEADINLFLDVVDQFFFPFAKKNILIPNPEWCFLTPSEIAQFDFILCKTKEAERIFKQFNPRTLFLGFSCKDRFNEKIAKNYRCPIHLAGASAQKGTNQLLKAWINHPEFPSLLLVQHGKKLEYPSSLHVIHESSYLPESLLIFLQNSCGLHICPSETEGFGHYLMEALCCKNVVVTTNAAPMNEFVFDSRCLVDFHDTAPRCLATNYYVNLSKLELTIANLLNLSEEELRIIGEKNRQFYLDNDRKFKKRLSEIFNENLID